MTLFMMHVWAHFPRCLSVRDAHAVQDVAEENKGERKKRDRQEGESKDDEELTIKNTKVAPPSDDRGAGQH
jgi:hypothetical protein